MSRQPISTADGQTAELIAQHAALLPLWLNFLDSRRAEQQKLRLAMRSHAAPAGSVVEAPAPVTPPATPTREAATPGPDPVAWLREAPATSPGAPFDLAADDPFAPPASVAPRAAEEAAATSIGARTGDSRDSAASAALLDPAAPSATAADVDDGARAGQPLAGSPEWLRHFEGDFSGDVSQELVAALAAVDPSALPYDLQQSLAFGQSPEEIAAAFVRAERAGELPDRLQAAVGRMEEVDFHFRDAAQRQESPTTDDPNGWF